MGNNITAAQILIKQRNAHLAAEKMIYDIERSISDEISADCKCKITKLLTELLIQNAECREFTHNVLASGTYQGYEIDALKILNASLDMIEQSRYA